MHINAKFFHKHIVNRRHMPWFIFLFKKLLCLYAVCFVTNDLHDLHRVDDLKNFAVNILLKLVCKSRTEIRALNWLVTY